MSRLIVVSNRLPSLEAQASAGGLAIALKQALRETGGIWVGWRGDLSEDAETPPETIAREGYDVASVKLSEAEVAGYYLEFANRCLWPIQHLRLDLFRFDDAAYEIYRRVNEKFADAVAELATDEDRIWVHDYHLISVGRFLRRKRPASQLGYFVHIPFPPAEVFSALPRAEELACDLLSYDLIGFQTQNCVDNFHAYLTHYLGGTVGPDGRIAACGREAISGVFPIGIDPMAFAEIAASSVATDALRQIELGAHRTAVIAGVERMDYTKGIPERFRAFQHLLQHNPSYRGEVSLFQVAAPSRMDIPEYQALSEEVDELAGHINGRFGTFDWTPIHFINRPMSQQAVAALYRASKIGLITPLSDGMNLVAKEYVAAQDPEDPGVLVLSRFAGAAAELTDALLVNPHDTAATADALKTAIDMPKETRIERWRQLMDVLQGNDIHNWQQKFLSALDAACQDLRQTPMDAA